MSRLMVAAGPPPSRLGQTSVQETVSATRTALLTLAGSDRLGCAIGAAAALLLDWDGVSEALAGIAQRLGADAGQRHQSWPSPAETMRMRSEERRGGQEWGSTCRSRWWPYP